MGKFSFKSLKEFFEKHEARLSGLAMVFGFIFDYLTLRRIDSVLDNVLIIVYLAAVGGSILLTNMYENGRLRGGFFEHVYEFLPFTLQFAIGGLFSAFTIFYSQSASFISSGIIVVTLFSLMVGNEFFRKRYEKLVFQVSIYFITIFAFFIYLLPLITKKMGVGMFLASGITSLVFISLFILLISKFARERYQESYKRMMISMGALYLLINFLYFANIIPPIPLSLTIGDVFHLVEKRGGGYLTIGEHNTWREKLNLTQTIHVLQGEPVYIFSSIFAPGDLSVQIVHNWQYYDEEGGEWVSANKISFPIKGGRDGGYRGFSKKENIFPGAWRVDITTNRGQVIGRVRFNIEPWNDKVKLETENL